MVFSCIQTEHGWIFTCKVRGFMLAYDLCRQCWRDSPDRDWLFWSIIQSLTRNGVRVESPQVNQEGKS